ncbi:MAG: hypothetical protein KKD18_02550 [Nanoarchaeota archaeon]|nr:hypothetical protein [Nanoarchaeota archaeon]
MKFYNKLYKLSILNQNLKKNVFTAIPEPPRYRALDFLSKWMQKHSDKKMKYEYAPDLQQRMIDIVNTLEMAHIKTDRVRCFRSRGSSTKRTIARCHALGKLMQHAMNTKAFYAIEFLEPFEKMSKKDQNRTIIHELMHIPKTFGGGFRQHDFVCDKNVKLLHEKFESLKSSGYNYQFQRELSL